MKEKLYKYATMIYFDFLRDPLIAFTRCFSRKDKALILDMDWYRWCLKEEEVMYNLHANPILSPCCDFLRIERDQLFKEDVPLEGVTGQNYREISYDGFNLWGICKATVAAKLGQIKIDIKDPNHLAELAKIYGRAAKGIERVEKLFLKLKPDSVFVSQGGVFDSRCVVEVARRLGVRVIGIENSMVGGFVILDDLSGLILNRYSLARVGRELLETHNVTKEDRKRTFNIWKQKLSDKADEHKTGGVDNATEIRDILSLTEGKKIILLLAQVRTDASIALDSTIYEDPVDMIEKIAEFAQDADNVILLIRLHPKEFQGASFSGTPYNRMTYKALIDRGIDKLDNVRIVEDVKINTYTLMDIADGGITINSQAGLEMSMLGKPVMVCGNAFYGGKGFTLDVADECALEATFNKLVSDFPMTEKQKEDALNFFHLLYERHLFDHKMSLHPERLKELFCRKIIRAD